MIGDLPAPDDVRGGAQILDPGVGAGADEHPVDPGLVDPLAGRQAHIIQGPGHLRGAGGIQCRRVGHAAIDADHVLRTGAPGHDGNQGRDVDGLFPVEDGVGIGMQGRPGGHGQGPGIILRRRGPALEIGEGGFVRGHQPGPGAALDGQVAERHALFHRQGLDGRAGIFDDRAGAPGGADPSDQGQGVVLCADSGRRPAGKGDAEVLGLLLAQGLGGQDVLDLGGADALGQGAKSAVGGGVGVAADDGHPRLGAPLLRPDHVDDAVADVAHREELDPVVLHVAIEGLQLQPRLLVGDGVDAEPLALRGHIVVGHGKGPVGPSDRPAGGAQAGEGLGRGHLVDQMQVDIEDRLAPGVGVDHVGVPDLVVERLASHAAHVRGETLSRKVPAGEPAVRRARFV